MSTIDEGGAPGKARSGTAQRLLIVLALALAFIGGSPALPSAVTPKAAAATAHCGWPRCTVYFNWDETRNMAYGNVQLTGAAGPFMGVLLVAERLHQWFILQYYNRGLYVGFNLSLAPWESQGLFGYRC